MAPMKRSLAPLAIATLSILTQVKCTAAPAAHTSFTVVEATIPDMRAAMEQGRVLCASLPDEPQSIVKAVYERKRRPPRGKR